MLTSRGCPYPCDFCVVPETNDRRWRGNSPEQVVEELITLRDRFDVHDFQVEDLNATVQHQRWEKICELLIERQANIRFYFVSGTKAETFHVKKIPRREIVLSERNSKQAAENELLVPSPLLERVVSVVSTSASPHPTFPD